MPAIIDGQQKLTTSTTHVEIVLKYDGKDVDDGSMPIEDVISALRGFSNAYGKIASAHDPNGQHQIRVSAINRSSFAVTILAWASEHKPQLIAVSASVASFIVGTIIKLIQLKKATKGHPPSPSTVKIDGNNNTVIIATGPNTTVEFPREVYDLDQSKELDGDLAKIVAPLKEGEVDAVSISAKGDTGFLEPEPVVVTSSEKEYFHVGETTTTTSKPVDLDGQLVSLNKDSNRGMFRMQNGNQVKYRFCGDDPTSMYGDFAYRGPVRAQCVASFDSNLELKGIEITNITRLQGNLFGTEISPTVGDKP